MRKSHKSGLLTAISIATTLAINNPTYARETKTEANYSKIYSSDLTQNYDNAMHTLRIVRYLMKLDNQLPTKKMGRLRKK